MKCRWRGGAGGYFRRGWVRAKRREYYRNGGRPPDMRFLPLMVLLAIVVLGGLPALLVVAALVFMVIRALVPLVAIAMVGLGFFMLFRAPDIRTFLTRFLFEGSGNMELSYKDITTRAIESVSQTPNMEKAVFTVLGAAVLVVYAMLCALLIMRLATS